MARNRITGRETQKMQEYTQGQISQAERRGIEFPTDGIADVGTDRGE